ncbi:MarR family transcriptional regulator [uncultured Alphaproteobacteria bacterium]|uniref:MarR family transcriptional regulator n=1 Tax=uncultured Alphaproteobacteria bacterium TaxID=91750 RepID=A0A212JR52_9PROT|nr:MarR family transcriptional regulator [uncultured Alphaproteobacteria bacterium]
MVEDVVRSLGLLSLGTRMKRIGERLQADTQRIIEDEGLDLAAAQHPFLAALDRLGPIGLGELAEAVGVAQPGATRTVKALATLDLVTVDDVPGDRRRRVVRLSAAGVTLVETAKRRVWPRVERAVADLCAGLDGPLLEQLARIEDDLAVLPLDRREDHR